MHPSVVGTQLFISESVQRPTGSIDLDFEIRLDALESKVLLWVVSPQCLVEHVDAQK